MSKNLTKLALLFGIFFTTTVASAAVVVYKCVPSPGHPCPSKVVIRRPPGAPAEPQATTPADEQRQNDRLARLEEGNGDAWLLGFGLGALHIDGFDGVGELSVGYHWDLVVPLELAFGFGGLVGQHIEALGVYDLRFGVAPSFGDTFSLAAQIEYLGAGGSDGPKQLALEGLRLEPRIALGKSVSIDAFFLAGHGEAALPDRRITDGFAWEAGLGMVFRR